MKTLNNLELHQVKIGQEVKLITGIGKYKVTATFYSPSKGNEAVISNGCGSSLIVKFSDLIEAGDL